ncbi:ABC transporter ATP-binding protein [Pikeienuella piscinae]|uniref:ABC transporter ATP-binding protein n=1 Tax=Pikeienuella piscinae TaxID=2748098 RepID=A0A7L5BXQ1_9RHOB|nr:ABC transporter ATP-binding protein [Pikeienuella piscinae]QIE56705.1 ABC transporter ATP-binding protein [Pikeienuella piscinae]
MLECSDLVTHYDAAQILFGVSFSLEKGRSACLIGRNGVGKTTCLRSIMGLTPPSSGAVTFESAPIAGLPAFRIAQRGIGFVPEDRRIFPDLTVEENLMIAERPGEGGVAWSIRKAYDVFPPLYDFRARQGGYLSGGQQQMLTIARTLMGSPRLLLLDEPTEGLSPLVVRALEQAILRLKEEGLTMLLAAQDVNFAHNVADEVYVMNRGAIVYRGTVAEAKSATDELRAHLAV